MEFQSHLENPHDIQCPDVQRTRNLEEWVYEELHLTFHRFCLLLVIIEMAKSIANILFQTVVGWWQTWSFSADYENPDVFYPILLMAIRAISWLDVTLSYIYLFACCLALCGLLKDRRSMLKPVIIATIPFHIWRLLGIIFYICVAILQTTQLFTLYSRHVVLIIYLLLWIIVWPMQFLLVISLHRQYRSYKQATRHAIQLVQ